MGEINLHPCRFEAKHGKKQLLTFESAPGDPLNCKVRCKKSDRACRAFGHLPSMPPKNAVFLLFSRDST
jgi:hypothetical protein